MKKLTAILLIISLGFGMFLFFKPATLPTADLASPSQEVRDAAAKELRAKAKPTSKIKWSLFSVRLKLCKTKNDVLELLKTYGVSTTPVGGWGSISEYMDYQLDDYWILSCEFDTNPNQLFYKSKLSPRWRCFFVCPATNYTGAWINYYANGQKFSEDFFQNGQPHGECTTYFPEGKKSSVWHYDDGKVNGMRTDYFLSGQIHVQCLYSNQMRIGDEVWFYTNGFTQLREHYDNGKWNGPKTIYFPSGKIKSQCLYSNNEQVGIEVVYNEDGSTNSIIDHSRH